MTIRTSALAVLSGLLLAATFPTIDLHPLAWFALVPLLSALRGQPVKTGFWLGGIAGLVFFSGTIYWITNSMHEYGNLPLVPASLITLLLCAYLALYPALFGAAVAFVEKERPAILFLAAPAVWTSLELARTYVFTGFPWALLGYSQYTFLPLIQIADITGAYGVSFLVVLVNTGITDIIAGRKRTIGTVVAGLVIVLALAYGIMRLKDPDAPGSITISVVQGNIDQDKKWDPAYQSGTIDVYKRLTQEAINQHPDLVIWPETSAPFYFTGESPTDRRLTAELREFVGKNGTPLLFGSPTFEMKARDAFLLRNSAFLLSGNGETDARYDKMHLVPFGEYVPLKSIFFFVEKMVQAVGDFVPGRDYTVMTLQNGGREPVRFGTVICYEIIFPDLVRKFVDRGAGIMTTITNDAWFGRTAAPFQHFSMAVFRAVENRVPVARAANTGVSGFIDAKGRILGATKIFTEACVTRSLAPGTAKTFYTRFGDVFSYGCVMFSLALLLHISLKSSRPLF